MRLNGLANWQRLSFLLSCAERTAPSYAAFSEHHGWGDPGALAQALDLGWKALAGQEVGAEEVRSCLSRCEAATPDTEDFDSEYVSAGLDAAVCCTLVLDFLLEDDVQKVVEAASLARDTVDMHIQEVEAMDPDDPDLEDRILHHPLMQRELERQREDLDMLAPAERTGDTIAALARHWRRPATSNIDRRPSSGDRG